MQAGKVKGRGRLSLQFTRLTSASDDEISDYHPDLDQGRAGDQEKGRHEDRDPCGWWRGDRRDRRRRQGCGDGAAAGGGAGTAVVLSKRGEDIRLGEGHVVMIRLSEPLVVEQ